MPDSPTVPSTPVGRTSPAGSSVDSVDASSDVKREERYHQALRHYDRAIRALRSGAYEGLTDRQCQTLLERLERDRARVCTATPDRP